MCLKGQQNGTGVTANTDIQAMHNFLMGGDFVGRFLSLLEAASLAAALVLQIAHLRRAQSRLEGKKEYLVTLSPSLLQPVQDNYILGVDYSSARRQRSQRAQAESAYRRRNTISVRP